MRKSTLLVAMGALWASGAMAQSYQEALQYSMHSPQATARTMGYGGASGAIGGDLGAINYNPAGIGVFRRSEYYGNLGFNFHNTKGTFLSEVQSDNGVRLELKGLGVVFSNSNVNDEERRRSDLKTLNIGLTYNRLANFNRNYTYGGMQNASSHSETFAYDANLYYNEFLGQGFAENSPAFLGYNSYLIDTITGGDFATLVDYEKGIRQQKQVSERGGVNELGFTVGGNVNENVLFGVHLGIPVVQYRSDKSFRESDELKNQGDFNYYDYNERLTTSGAGFNLKAGLIVLPTDALRLGIALHSPTFYKLKDEFQSTLTTDMEIYGRHQIVGPRTEFDYNLTTPWKAILSAGYMISKKGFISLDYEFVDYSSARYKLNTINNEGIYGMGAFSQTDQYLKKEVKDNLKAGSVVRIGTEWRLKTISLRAGAGWYSSPYKKSANFNMDRLDVSAGFGYRKANFYTDMALVHSMYREGDVAYTMDYSNGTISAPTATLQTQRTVFAWTVGVKF